MSTIYQRSNGIFYVNYMVGGRQVRHSLRTRDSEMASAKYAALMAYRKERTEEPPAHHPGRIDLPWTAMVEEGAIRGEWLWAMFERTRDRARSREIPFNLGRDQLRTIALRSEGCCELTGLSFSWQNNGSRFPPFAPTLDRIHPRHGYSLGNCRMICHAANLALCDWGEEVFETIAFAFLKERGRI